INTLSSVIFEQDKKTAHKFLVELSAIIRSTLKNSKDISVSLKEEIDFVKNYLQIQQFRHDNIFDYKINIGTAIDDNTPIPKMIIQTFAENSVKHGLVQKDGKGNLLIEIIRHKDNLSIIVEDDGIGREKAAQVSLGSTGKGHGIINQIIDMYNKLKNTSVTYKIIDKYDDEGNTSGTKVEVVVPLG
ncbi:MAG: histidine kinase, partial [Desulfobacula sp.]|nr:histidine kinase [Desulfobacula sp.]